MAQIRSRKPLFFVAVAALFLFSQRALADNDPHATGLRPPSPEQKAWERAHMIVPQKIKLNALGLSRINAHRVGQGEGMLSPGDVEVSAIGDEIEGATEEQNARQAPSLAPMEAPAALPSSVDNSTLKYFPPIRSQGSIGSCAQWAGMYYCFTYMNALARDLDAQNGGDNCRFSPKFTYNMVNGGADVGSWQTDGWSIATKHGAATWTDWPYDSDYRGWPLAASVWRNALNVRVNATGYVYNCDTTAGLTNLKTLLVNGYILTYATYINSWQFKKISNDPSTSADDSFVGKDAAYWVNGTNGGHAMTVVGYNDAIWVDINGNGLVDPGEKGALRIANSWGTGWEEGGFTWLAYDALKSVSGVSGGPSVGRGPAWWGSYAMWVTAKSSYTPTALAQFTLNHAVRNQLRVSLGLSDVTGTTPTTTWSPNTVLQNAGGAYAFNGTASAVDAAFVLDFSDIASVFDTPKRWYLRVQDTAAGNTATVKSFKWINGADSAEVVKGSLPATVDNTLTNFSVDATMTRVAGNTPPTISIVADRSTAEDTPTGSVAFTIGDAETAVSSLTVSGASSNGTLLPHSAIVFGGSGANRTVVLSPALNQNGTTNITLTVTDGGGLTAQTAFKLTVTAVNDPPVALAQSLGVPSNTPKPIQLGGTDVDGDTLSYAYAQPSHGSVTGTAPLVTYTPNNGFVGFDTFTFTASDGLLTSPPASIALMIDDTPPAVSITQPAEGATVMYTITLVATATDNQSVDRVLFYVDGVVKATATSGTSVFTAGWDTSSTANGSHVLTARAYDNAGNTTLSSAVTVTVDNPALAQLAVAPGSLGFYGVEGGAVPPVSPLAISTASAGGAPSWTISVSTPWLSVSPLSGRGPNTVSVGVSPTGLSTGVYTGTVTVTPAGSPGNPGGAPLLVPITLMITPDSDITPPSVPTNVEGVSAGPTTAIVSWSASSDGGGSGVAGYRLLRDGQEIAQPTATHFTNTGLTAGASYDFAVCAADKAGNVSNPSETVRVTVSAAGPAGLVEAYSYPDPAPRGAPPVIRAVLGDVTNVEVTIYDAKGTPVHSARMDVPNAIVDGQAAYDYPWTGDIPSGVYYAVIHGKAGNDTVKAKTKLTVVR